MVFYLLLKNVQEETETLLVQCTMYDQMCHRTKAQKDQRHAFWLEIEELGKWKMRMDGNNMNMDDDSWTYKDLELSIDA